jgi:GNAT superfamily N-acetyltransferase
MSLHIQRLDPHQAQAAYDFVGEYYRAMNVIARDDSAAFSREYFAPRAGFWLATLDGATAGCIALRVLALPDSTELDAEIKRMYVRPEFRGQGIAQQLLLHAERFAADVGYRSIYLDTALDMLAAARLYRASGYQPCSRYNDNPQAALFFRKELPHPF